VTNWWDTVKQNKLVNLPKFKVKPFNVNKPDEEDDCERKVKEIENRLYARELIDDSDMNALENDLKNIAVNFDVAVRKRPVREDIQRYTIKFIPRGYLLGEDFPKGEYLKMMIRVDRRRSGAYSGRDTNIKPFAESSLGEEMYCKILDAIERDVEINEPNFRYWKIDDTTDIHMDLSDLKGSDGTVIDRGRDLSCIVDDIEYAMSINVECYLISQAPEYVKQMSDLEKDAFRKALVLIHRYIDKVKVKFTE